MSLNLSYPTKFFLGIIFFSFSVFTFSLAQQKTFDQPYACPDYEFTQNHIQGVTHEDVFVIQQILNLDSRTRVAQTGPGSPGKETAFFGKATREALKRFQALFIEYIEVADGKFTTRTRNAMNRVCKGPFFVDGTGGVFDTATTTDQTPPSVNLTGPESALPNETFRITLNASEAINTPTISAIIAEGATARDVRKLSSSAFSISLAPNEGAKEVLVQVEAEQVSDLAGNKNENASNELSIEISTEATPVPVAKKQDPLDTSALDNILNSVSSLVPTTQNDECAKVKSVSVDDFSNPCYGKVPMKDPKTGEEIQEQPPEEQSSSMAQMLAGLLQGLMSALGGMKDAGGSVGGNAACACSGAPTINFNALKGVSGRQGDSITKGVGTGQFVGKQGPPPFPCGQMKYGSAKQCKDSCSGTCLGDCCNPQFDMTGMPVTGTIVN